MLDDELIKKARQANIVQYLLNKGEPLLRSGRRYKHKEYDSLVFTDNSYYWNSRQEHGNAVDFLVRFYGFSFSDAVRELIGSNEMYFDNLAADKNSLPKLEALELSNDYKRSIAYLNKTRGISYSLIKYLVDTKNLFQENKTNNIVFPIYDELGEYVGAELQGTLTEKRFKGIKTNTKYGYGYNVRYPAQSKSFRYALFFESAVDLLSFIDIAKLYENKSLQECILVSMAGLKVNIVTCVLRAFTGDLRPVMCVDNDNAGLSFLNALDEQNIAYMRHIPQYPYKDYNEMLQTLKKTGGKF